jgi:hypothetical protein
MSYPKGRLRVVMDRDTVSIIADLHKRIEVCMCNVSEANIPATPCKRCAIELEAIERLKQIVVPTHEVASDIPASSWCGRCEHHRHWHTGANGECGGDDDSQPCDCTAFQPDSDGGA